MRRDDWAPRPAWRAHVAVPITAAAWTATVAAATDGRTGELVSALAVWWVIAIPLAMLLETLAHVAFPPPLERALIVGSGATAELVSRKLRRHPEYRIDTCGPVPAAASGVDLSMYDRVVVATDESEREATLQMIERLRHSDVRIDIVPKLLAVAGFFASTSRIEELPLMRVSTTKMTTVGRSAKRIIDLVGAVFALVVTAPLFAVVAIAIRLDSAGPILFRQTRLGQGMSEFTNLKFRTMRTDTRDDVHRSYIKSTMTTAISPETNGLFKLEREPDITAVGRWLRRTSLDELPQFWNVLRGDISLVGPRPCIPYEVEFFEPRHYDRFLVPAGITGLWQVTARARSTFGEALDIDVVYAHGRSLRLDLAILLRTPGQLLRLRSTA